jgi:pilus assembly protein CpaB
MRQRAVIFIILAAFFGLGTVYFARSWVSRERAPVVQTTAAVEKPAISVLVAAHDLPTGSFIRPEDLRWQTWPEGQIADTYLLKDKEAPEALSGAVVRLRIVAGEPITNNRVIKPGDRGFLAAVLTPGMRAVAVPVTPISGVAGLVFPGDHVDIILSHQIRKEAAGNEAASTAFASETVLTDLRILAIDQSTADIEGKPVLAKTATFEVTPKQVEAIEVASALGTLYLSLRAIAGSNVDVDGVTIAEDEGPAHGTRSVSHTWDSDVSPLINHGSAAQLPTVTILRGAKSGSGGTTSVAATTSEGSGASTPPASSK